MSPLLSGFISSYFLSWGLAAGVGFAIGTFLAARNGFSPLRSAVALATAAFTVLAGSKILYWTEAALFPFDDYVPVGARTGFHGARIPGGILLLALTTPPVCKLLDLPWRRFGDLEIPLAALGLVFIRLGCFLNGCCFGSVSSVPWAVSFPLQSWVFWYHQRNGWLPPAATSSLPVHPLQLYFLAAALITLVILLWLQRRKARPGTIQLTFYTIFFSTTAILEHFRANSLTLNMWLTTTAALAFTLLIAWSVSSGRSRPHALATDTH